MSSQVQTTVPLWEYLYDVSEQLDCYFTLEDLRGPEGGTASVNLEIEPDMNVTSIDALVGKLNQELPGYQALRSTDYPSVVHLINDNLLQEDYLMEEVVSVQYSGELSLLSDYLGTLLGGRIGYRGSYKGLSFHDPLGGDFTTQVDIDVQDETVRNVLTGYVPLEEYSRFLWEAVYASEQNVPDFLVMFGGHSAPEPESLWEYLATTSEKLDCYFTLEDRLDPNRENPRAYYGIVSPDDVDDIDELVVNLGGMLEGVGYQVVRSTENPSVVHIIDEDLLGPDYVLEEEVSVDFTGTAQGLADHLGTLLDGEIGSFTESTTGYSISYPYADYTTNVEVDVQNRPVRDVLTGAVPAVPLEDYSPVLWQAIYVPAENQPDYTVVFRTPWREDDEEE